MQSLQPDPLFTLSPHTEEVNDIVFMNESAVVTASDDNMLCITDFAPETAVYQKLCGHAARINSCAVSLIAGRWTIASASHDATVRLWQQSGPGAAWQVVGSFHACGSLSAISLSQSGALMACDYRGGTRLASEGSQGLVYFLDASYLQH